MNSYIHDGYGEFNLKDFPYKMRQIDKNHNGYKIQVAIGIIFQFCW